MGGGSRSRKREAVSIRETGSRSCPKERGGAHPENGRRFGRILQASRPRSARCALILQTSRPRADCCSILRSVKLRQRFCERGGLVRFPTFRNLSFPRSRIGLIARFALRLAVRPGERLSARSKQGHRGNRRHRALSCSVNRRRLPLQLRLLRRLLAIPSDFTSPAPSLCG